MGVYDPKKQKFWNAPTIFGMIVALILMYCGWFYLPHSWAVWRYTGRMRAAGFEAYRQYDNKVILKKLISEARSMGLRGIDEESFELERIGYDPEEMADWDEYKIELFTKRGKAFNVYFIYDVDAKWPLSGKITPLHFEREIEVDLATIVY